MPVSANRVRPIGDLSRLRYSRRLLQRAAVASSHTYMAVDFADFNGGRQAGPCHDSNGTKSAAFYLNSGE